MKNKKDVPDTNVGEMLSAEEWIMERDKVESESQVVVKDGKIVGFDFSLADEYAAYAQAFTPEPPDDVIKAIEAEYPIPSEHSILIEDVNPLIISQREYAEICRTAMLKGYQLSRQSVDWGKIKDEFFNECTELDGSVVRKVSVMPHALLDWFKSRLSGKVGESEWISVDDRLPEPQQPVIFVVKSNDEAYNGRVLGGKYIDGAFPTFSIPGIGFAATHWQPLPNPPKQ